MSDERQRAAVVDVEWRDEAPLRWVSRVAWLAAAIGPLGVALSWIDPMLLPAAVFGVGIASCLPVLSLLMPLVPLWLRERIGGDGAAEVDAERGLSIRRGERRVRVAPERLAMAWAREPRVVEVLLHDGELRTTVADEEEAAALVAAIRRVAGRGRAYAVDLETPGLRILRQSLAAWAPLWLATLFMIAGPVEGALALTGAVVAAVLGARGTPRLRFGADGVEILGRLRRRYVPYRTIRGVRLRSTVFGRRSVELELDDGRHVTVAWLVERSRAWLVQELVDEGLRMLADGEAAGARVASLDREGEDDEVWRDRVAAAAKRSDYRGAAVDADRLWALMRNPAADPEQRVGAALALREQPSGRARIRVAAEVSAEPEVRAALEALAEEQLEAASLSRALRRLDGARRRD